MPSTISPIINGHRYSYASIELRANGQVYFGVTGIAYGSSLEPGLIRGEDPEVIGRTPGKADGHVELEMLQREFQFLIESLGPGFGLVPFEIDIVFAETRQTEVDRNQGVSALPVEGVTTHVLSGCRITRVDFSGQEGPEANVVKLTLHPMRVAYGDGLTIERHDDDAPVTPAGDFVGDADLTSGLPDGIAVLGPRSKGCEGATYPTNAANTVILGGIKLPGIATISATPARDVTVEKAPGRDGGELIDTGYVPGQIEIQVKIWTPAQWDAWQEAADRLWPPAGKISAGFSDRGQFNPAAILKKGEESNVINKGANLASSEALTLEHPRSNVLHMKAVVIASISIGEPGPEPQSYVFTIKCAEWVKPPPVNVTKKTTGKTKLEKPLVQLGPAPANARASANDAPGKTGGTP